MIDVHTHLLPGVDDGSRSVDVSREVLQRFRREGVETVVCTPHLEASRASSAPRARYGAVLAELAAAVPDGPRLLQGFEIMLDLPGADLAAPELRLGASRAVLVEFPRTAPPAQGTAELFRLRMSGVVPVLAHPERYWGCTVEQVREWRRCGAVIQMDAVMLFGGSPLSDLARALLGEGLVDCMASDNHGDTRSLAAARDWLVETGNEAQADLLTRENARRLLADEELVPVAPLARPRGFIDRLLTFAGRGRSRTDPR